MCVLKERSSEHWSWRHTAWVSEYDERNWMKKRRITMMVWINDNLHNIPLLLLQLQPEIVSRWYQLVAVVFKSTSCIAPSRGQSVGRISRIELQRPRINAYSYNLVLNSYEDEISFFIFCCFHCVWLTFPTLHFRFPNTRHMTPFPVENWTRTISPLLPRMSKRVVQLHPLFGNSTKFQ